MGQSTGHLGLIFDYQYVHDAATGSPRVYTAIRLPRKLRFPYVSAHERRMDRLLGRPAVTKYELGLNLSTLFLFFGFSAPALKNAWMIDRREKRAQE
jgi:hypothetical protein